MKRFGRVASHWLACGAVAFLLAIGVAGAARGEEPADAAEMIWQGIRDQNDPVFFRLFLDKYPGSRHADEARAKLGQIASVSGETWEGFRRLRDAPLPKAINKRNLARSIYMVTTFTPDAKSEIVDISRLKGNPLKGAGLYSDRYLRGMQLVSCQQQKIRYCPVGIASGGTAFAVGDKATMVTARHVMSAWALAATKANPDLKFESIVQPFLLMNDQGTIVYNSIRSKAKVKVTFWNSYRLPERYVDLTESEDNLLYMQSDYLEFAFDRPVFQGFLQRSSVDVSKRETSLYALGYPDVDAFFSVNPKEKKSKRRMANGDLLASSGGFLGQQQAIVLTSVYAFDGSSGGPVLDSNGGVLGLVAFVQDARATKRGRFERSYFVTIDKTRLRQTWDEPYWRDMLARQAAREEELKAAKLKAQAQAQAELKLAAEKAAKKAAEMKAGKNQVEARPQLEIKPATP